MAGVTRYAAGVPAEVEWTAAAEQCAPGICYSHPQLQEAAFAWAAEQGAAMVRPAKVTAYARNGRSCISATQNGDVLTYANAHMPAGSLDHAQQAGPIGYFSCADTWGSVLAGNGVVLIGDAAGSPDPCQGHGTPLLFHDVRLLSELLLSGDDWDAATTAFATERERVFAVVQAFDRWSEAFFEHTEAAIRLREGNERARQADPDLGGFARIERIGPAGLVADAAARAHYFGEDL